MYPLTFYLILFVRQQSEDFEIIGCEQPTDRQLFDQLRDEISPNLSLLHVERLSHEYTILASLPADRPLNQVRDELQARYDDGAAGFFQIVGVSNEEVDRVL